MAKNAAHQISSAREPNSAASPIKMASTPVIIGLRTRQYGPCTTSRRVGSHEASVPLPMLANSRRVHTQSASPAAMSVSPTSATSPARTPSRPQPMLGPPPAITMSAGTTTITVPGSSMMARA